MSKGAPGPLFLMTKSNMSPPPAYSITMARWLWIKKSSLNCTMCGCATHSLHGRHAFAGQAVGHDILAGICLHSVWRHLKSRSVATEVLWPFSEVMQSFEGDLSCFEPKTRTRKCGHHRPGERPERQERGSPVIQDLPQHTPANARTPLQEFDGHLWEASQSLIRASQQ